MMKSKLDRSAILYIGFLLFSLLFEVLSFSLLELGVFPKYFLFDIGFLLIVVGLVNLLPSFLARSILLAIVLVTQIVLAITNVIVFQATGELFSFSMLSSAAEGFAVFSMSFINFAKLAIVAFALIVFILLLIFNFTKNIKNKTERTTYQIIAMSLVMLMCGCASYSFQREMLYSSADSSSLFMFESENYLYTTLISKTDAYKNYGTFGFYVRDVTNIKSNTSISESQILESAQYFASGVGQQNNSEYYGISEDNNVITILLESMEYFAIDPIFTPNLYNLLYKDGILLSNFYAENRTNISEGLTLFGSYSAAAPITNATSDIISVLSDENYNATIAQKLNLKGYETSYYHANSSSFYTRDATFGSNTNNFSNLMFQNNMTRLSNYDPTDNYFWTNVCCDSEIVSVYFDDMFPSDKKYFTHLSTIATHGSYNSTDKSHPTLVENYNTLLSEENSDNYNAMWDYLTDLGYSKPNAQSIDYFNWYKATAMDTDKMIEILFSGLEANGTLDNTTILLFSDHKAYYHNLTYALKTDMTNGNTEHTENFHIPAIIYDQKLQASLNGVEHYGDTKINSNGEEKVMTGYKFAEFCSTFNLCTTLLDLLGLEYNPNFYMADSIFATDNSTNVFQPNIGDRQYFNNRISLVYKTAKWCESDVTEEEIEKFKVNASKIYEKVQHIDRLYSNPRVIQLYGELTNSSTTL